MAIGAKPLLNELKEQLSNSESPISENSHSTKNERQAERVEAVLDLFKDQLAKFPRLQRYVAKTNELSKRYQGSLEIVNGRKKEDSRVLGRGQIEGEGRI